ncbi:DNA polymerase delta, subunit 4-domain-containing protein [Gaertneriomyces semiglobifer]|nr:DNA polymerase delta, subunit 4-domain-containing protein [Gaertneriomyces semiglobifer]
MKTRASGRKATAGSSASSLESSTVLGQRKLTDFKSTKKKGPVRKDGKKKIPQEVVTPDEAPVDIAEVNPSLEDTQKSNAEKVKLKTSNLAAPVVSQAIKDLLSDRPSLLKLLRDFDLNYGYGPCVGLSRLERWKRAKKLDLNPPENVGAVLTMPEIQRDDELREPLWHKEAL